MSEREIVRNLHDLHRVDVSPDLIDTVTDAVLEEVAVWRAQPLGPVYPLVYFDALRVKIRDEGLVRNKTAHIALGVRADGTREVLGFWLERNESLVRDGRLRRSDVEMVIPARTLNRRIKEGQSLRLEEADAVARLIRVRGHADRVFDDPALSERWLSSPNPELGDETPIEMARTDVGAREVEAVLLRIEHGVVG